MVGVTWKICIAGEQLPVDDASVRVRCFLHPQYSQGELTVQYACRAAAAILATPTVAVSVPTLARNL